MQIIGNPQFFIFVLKDIPFLYVTRCDTKQRESQREKNYGQRPNNLKYFSLHTPQIIEIF